MVGVQSACFMCSGKWSLEEISDATFNNNIHLFQERNSSPIRLEWLASERRNPAVSSSSLAWELQQHLGTRHCYMDSGILTLTRQALLLNKFPAPLAGLLLLEPSYLPFFSRLCKLSDIGWKWPHHGVGGSLRQLWTVFSQDLVEWGLLVGVSAMRNYREANHGDSWSWPRLS